MKSKEKCNNCKSWNSRDDMKTGLCKSKARKEEKNIPFDSQYFTYDTMRACKSWKGKNEN